MAPPPEGVTGGLQGLWPHAHTSRRPLRAALSRVSGFVLWPTPDEVIIAATPAAGRSRPQHQKRV